MNSKHSKLKRKGSSSKAMTRERCRRLGKMLCWRGRRFGAEADQPFHQSLIWPMNIMTRPQMVDVADWALHTPNRWQLTFRFHMEDFNGGKYICEFDYESSQQYTSDELADWRSDKLVEARSDNSVNVKHIVIEEFEARIL